MYQLLNVKADDAAKGYQVLNLQTVVFDGLIKSKITVDYIKTAGLSKMKATTSELEHY